MITLFPKLSSEVPFKQAGILKKAKPATSADCSQTREKLKVNIAGLLSQLEDLSSSLLRVDHHQNSQNINGSVIRNKSTQQ